MIKRAKPYDEYLIKSLKDPVEACAYLQAALEDGESKIFLLALRNVAVALGGVGALSKKAKLNRETLYRTLSEQGNPELTTLSAILKALGFEIMIKPKKKMLKRAA